MELKKEQRREDEFLITRTFDAPLDMVWKAHTDPGRLEKWWGPPGFIMKVIKFDLKPGGLIHYSMQSPEGDMSWAKCICKEVVPQEKIVLILSFADEQANSVHHPLAPDWPLEMLNTITFSERDGKTTLTLRAQGWNATERERSAFIGGFGSMEQGFTASFDKLHELLSEQK